MAKAGSLGGLIKFVHRAEWAETLGEVLERHVGPACEKMGVEPQDLGEIIGDDLSATVWGCALEDLMAREFHGGRNVIDDYLRRRGHLESGGVRRYLHALRSSVMSVHEVSDVVAGQSFLARDLIRGGEPVRVLEVSGSKSLKAWDRIGARIVRLGPEWRMSGGVLVLSREVSDFLVEALNAICEQRLPEDLRERAEQIMGTSRVAEVVRELAVRSRLDMTASTITSVWLADALDRALNQRLPELQNRDGHAIVWCTSTFPQRSGATPTACREALAPVSKLQQKSASSFTWVGPTALDAKHTPPTQSEGITLMAETCAGETILGSIEIKGKAIVLSTNSRERAERGEAMIAAALGDLVEPPSREETATEDLLAERKGRPARKSRQPIPPEEARNVVHGYLDRHYRRTLDQPVPALGNLTPREAARDAASRAKVVAWLKHMENHSAKAGGGADPMASYDFGWIWCELGIAGLRV